VSSKGAGDKSSVPEFARGAKAVIALPDMGGAEAARRDIESRLDEAAGLAAAIGIEVVERLHFKIRGPKPATLFGSGQVKMIGQAVERSGAELLIVDAPITPIQQKNLETGTKAKVIDRTGLILEIFGERAATSEGRLQVELAHLDYQAGRLVRSWTHLERQRGGFGFLGGPGETQIEADRRLIRDRMAKLKKELEQVTRTRTLHRSRRQRAPWPVIALVGYTNAGKSTLFNRLTNAGVMAENLLFATLDPTMREISLPGFDKAILSDTVGFISELPTQLVAAFRATLEEVISADLIIHVRDISHPDSDAQREDVETVLAEIGVRREGGAPLIEAWNKIDLLEGEEPERVRAEAARREDVILISAVSGEGLDTLLDCAATHLRKGAKVRRITLPAEAGEAIAWLHANGEIVSEERGEAETEFEVRLSDADWARFQSRQAERA
jgi:GTP-binding protein HflX